MQGAILKSFTYENRGGNGAGVILLDKEITEQEKQQIAAEIGLSETAFILRKDEENFDVSFFTPVCEVDLCGHATIAAFYYLGLTGMIKGKNETKRVYQKTNAGKLGIEVVFGENVEYVMMQQQSPAFFGDLEGDDVKMIASSLNTGERNIGLEGIEIYPSIVSTGLRDIMVPVKSRGILNGLNVNLDGIRDVSIEKDVVGYHVYTVDNGTIYARNFAPKVGIDEECATGTSNGALCGLLYTKKLISDHTEIIQGESMNETSLINVKIIEKGGLLDIYAGGMATIVENIII